MAIKPPIDRSRGEQSSLHSKIAVIDMGYNSLKLVIYDVRSNDTFSVLQKETVPTRLGQGIDERGYLHNDAMDRVISGLKLFADILSLESVNQIIAIATSGVRDCVNKDAFLTKVRRETGFDFRVLSGRDEALFSFKGAASSVRLGDSILFFDIGGGSLEIVKWENSLERVLSLPLGGLRLSNRFPGRKRSYDKMRDYVLDFLPGRKELNLTANTRLLGVGGTLRALARFQQEETDYPLNKIHNYEMTIDSVERLHEELRMMSLDELVENDSIGQSRADTIVAGSLVIELLMNKLDFRDITVSTHGLRDGVLASYLTNDEWFPDSEIARFSLVSASRTFSGIAGELDEGTLSPTTSDLIGAFMKRGLITVKESEFLKEIVPFLLLKKSLYSAETVFDTIIDQDSALSHLDQLILALTIVRTISAKSSDRLLVHYKSLLAPKTRPVLKRLAALAKFLELVEKTGCHVQLSSWGRNELRIIVAPSDNKKVERFPKELLGRLVKELANAFEIAMKYELKETAEVPASLARHS